MNRSIKIAIPNPCHEDWGKMTPKDKGRFCENCEKVVVDMTKLTDNEIYKLFDTNSKICGRFRRDQLNRPIEARVLFKGRKSNWSIAASLLVGLSLLSSCDTIEENMVSKTRLIVPLVDSDTVNSISCGTSLGIGEDMVDVNGVFVLADSSNNDESKDSISVTEFIMGNVICTQPVEPWKTPQRTSDMEIYNNVIEKFQSSFDED